MAILSRPPKQGGSTTYQGKVAQGYTKILATEVDADLNTIFDAWNDGVDAVNIRPNAVTAEKIAPGAVGDRELADTATAVPSGPAGGDLGGVYPNPTVAKASGSDFNVVSGRIHGGPNGDQFYLNADSVGWAANHPWAPYSVARAGWLAGFDAAGDLVTVWRKPPGAAAATDITTPFVIRGSTGRTECQLADLSVTNAMLARGATVQTAGFQGAIANFNTNSGAGAWVWKTIAGPAGPFYVDATRNVFIFVNIGCCYAGGTNVAWVRVVRDGAGVLVQLEIPLQFGALTEVPFFVGFPTYDNTAAVGNHTYQVDVLVQTNAGNIVTASQPGGFSVWIMS